MNRQTILAVSTSLVVAAVAIVLWTEESLTAELNASPIEFNRDIRPILSDKCFACHGFDPKHRQAQLRLDNAEGAYGTRESGEVVIKPGAPEGSELWRRINSKDDDERMPPPKSHKTLSKAEKDLIRRWIVAGAPYEKHWAFVPPTRPEMPVPAPGQSPGLPQGTIDVFIQKKLAAAGVSPSPPADKETLLRRLSFDLMARRMAERGVRFIQLYHRGWDHHNSVTRDLPLQCQDVDQPQAALLQDLRQRGLPDETLVVWGGEFGRTAYCQGKLTPTQYGRDHHPRCFTMWLAGGGVKPGISYGQTDAFSYNFAENPVTAYDLHATMLHCLGIEHERFTYKNQGLDFKLTGVEPSRVIKEVLA